MTLLIGTRRTNKPTGDAIRPMLAFNIDDRKEPLTLPWLCSPKLDGVRALVVNGQLQSRKGKLIPSIHLQKILATPALEGFDGELTHGNPAAPDTFRRSMSAVMSIDSPEATNVTYRVFDLWNHSGTFTQRLEALTQRVVEAQASGIPVSLVPQLSCDTHLQIEVAKETYLQAGYEGLILKDPKSFYQHTRSKSMLKVKEWQDSEGIIIGFVERLTNTNAAQINSLGYTERSTAADGRIPCGTLGTLVVRDEVTGQSVRIGGFTAALAKNIWENQQAFIGKRITYRWFNYGIKEAPRHARFKGFRPEGF